MNVCTALHCTAGLNVLFSGETDEFSFSVNAYDILIPAFHSALLTSQPAVSVWWLCTTLTKCSEVIYGQK